MNPEFREEAPRVQKGESKSAGQKPKKTKSHRNLLAEWSSVLLSIGLGESMLRVGTALLSLILIAAAVWLLNTFNDQIPLTLQARPALAAGPTAAPIVLFVGSFGHTPNRDAIGWLFSEIWPRIRAERPAGAEGFARPQLRGALRDSLNPGG